MDSERVVFLAIGVLIVIAVGRLLAMSGRRYLANSVTPNERRSASPAATLVAVFFHLVTLGIVALLAIVPVGGSPAESLLFRLGVLLLALALVFGVTLTLLSRRRQEALATEIDAGRVILEEPQPVVRVRPVEEEETR